MIFVSLNASLLTLNLLSSVESPPVISASGEIFICIPRCLEIGLVSMLVLRHHKGIF